MKKILILAELHQINERLTEYLGKNPQHKDSILFLQAKFSAFSNALINDSKELPENIEWINFFAPRIIFEGINDRHIARSVDKIRRLIGT